MASPFAYARASTRILRFFARMLWLTKSTLPEMYDGRMFEECKPRTLVLPGDLHREFTEQYSKLTRQMVFEFPPTSFRAILVLSFAVRMVQCVVAFVYGWQLGLSAGLLQFLVAPLSLVLTITRITSLFFDIAMHYSVNAICLLGLSRAAIEGPKLVFDWKFICAFFAIDFILCLLLYLRNSEPLGVVRLTKSISYGTFNAKSYFFVVFGCLLDLELDIYGVILTSLIAFYIALPLRRLLRYPGFDIVFYIDHRVGHIPGVYQHAHKMHHYLYDTTPFDAHIYGSSLNEEYLWICAEVLPCALFGLAPFWINLYTLFHSWEDKLFHTRSVEGSDGYDVENFHADHHTFHRHNFSTPHLLGALVDFYFDTARPGMPTTEGMEVLREERDGSIMLTVQRAGAR